MNEVNPPRPNPSSVAGTPGSTKNPAENKGPRTGSLSIFSVREMKVVSFPMERIKPQKDNPKLHNDDAILESIKEYGFNQPILIQKSTHKIIAGHGRYKAASRLGMKRIPAIELDMSDEEAESFALVDNQSTIDGGWNESLLKDALKRITFKWPRFKMAGMGFAKYMKDLEKKKEEMEFNPEYHLHFKTDKDQAEIITCELHRLREINGEEELKALWREKNLVRMAKNSSRTESDSESEKRKKKTSRK